MWFITMYVLLLELQQARNKSGRMQAPEQSIVLKAMEIAYLERCPTS